MEKSQTENIDYTVTEIDAYPYFEQSANVLFKFLKEPDYLKQLLAKKSILPRYSEEPVEYLNLKNIEKIAFPMSCFCDIHLSKIKPHVSFYGFYGIGLKKSWGIDKGIQPVQYMNTESHLCKSLENIFKASMENIDNEQFESYSDHVLMQLLYVKPITGEMYRDGEYLSKTFHDEKEWRYIPEMKEAVTSLPLIIPQKNMVTANIKLYSDAIEQSKELWLDFNYSDIKYIIVKTENDRDELIDFICNEITISINDNRILISKIIVYDELKEDV
ncbi:MAG: hypothetical protein JEZ08_16675 [Clostridiales bacterium]|nr:hypothetical protein [Clostridiales bacterium]